MCNSRFVVEGAQCMKERLQGRTDRQGEMHCLEKAQAKLAMWMGKATATTPETAPGSDEEPGQ
jgi:hypothetical protein